MLFVIDQHEEPRTPHPSTESVRTRALELSDQLTSDYIWQRDAFGLEVRAQGGDGESVSFLSGSEDFEHGNRLAPKPRYTPRGRY